MMALTIAWNTGEQTITRVGGTPTEYDYSERDDLGFTIFEVIGEGLEAWEVLDSTIEVFTDVYQAYKTVKMMRNLRKAGWSVSAKGSRSWYRLMKASWRQVSKVKSASKISKASTTGIFSTSGTTGSSSFKASSKFLIIEHFTLHSNKLFI